MHIIPIHHTVRCDGGCPKKFDVIHPKRRGSVHRGAIDMDQHVSDILKIGVRQRIEIDADMHPIGVAHHGIYSTNVYDTDVQINAGDFLYASASGTLVKSTGWGYCTSSGSWNHNNPIAVAMNTLTTARLSNGRHLHIKLLI